MYKRTKRSLKPNRKRKHFQRNELVVNELRTNDLFDLRTNVRNDRLVAFNSIEMFRI
jgi:hypothetical protein